MSKFKIGDRVMYVNPHSELNGKVGTVINTTNCDCGVVFDEYEKFLHNLNGRCPDGHGWWCIEAELELISEHRFNVIITSAGDTTTAKLLHGKKVEKEVSVGITRMITARKRRLRRSARSCSVRTNRKRMPNLWESTARRCISANHS